MVSEQDREKLLAFIHGELDEDESRRIADLIERDAAFRREFEETRALSGELESLFAAAPREDLAPEQFTQIRQRAAGSGSKKRWGFWAMTAASLATAALALFVIFSGREEIPSAPPKVVLEQSKVPEQSQEGADPISIAGAAGGDPALKDGAAAELNGDVAEIGGAVALAESTIEPQAAEPPPKAEGQVASGYGAGDVAIDARTSEETTKSPPTSEPQGKREIVALHPKSSERLKQRSDTEAPSFKGAGAAAVAMNETERPAKPMAKAMPKTAEKSAGAVGLSGGGGLSGFFLSVDIEGADFENFASPGAAKDFLMSRWHKNQSCLTSNLPVRLNGYFAILALNGDGQVENFRLDPDQGALLRCLKAKLEQPGQALVPANRQSIEFKIRVKIQ